MVNAREASVVRRIYDLYARQKLGLAKICRNLRDAGIRGKLGGTLAPTGVRNILRSPIYIGQVRCGSSYTAGDHNAIIDGPLFAEAQDLATSRTQLAPRCQQHQHILAGLARCGVCGDRLYVHMTSSHRRADGTGRHRYRNYMHRADLGSTCSEFTKSADRLEQVVIDEVRVIAARPDFQKDAFAEAERQVQEDAPDFRAERAALETRLTELGRAFDQWAERLDQGKIRQDQFDRRNAALLKERDGIEDRLAELEAQEAKAESIEVGIEQVRVALQDFDRVWDAMTIDEQREMIRSLVEYLKVWKERAELKLLFMPPIEISVKFKRGPAKKSAKAS